MKFKRPKNGHFYNYCFQCQHWEFAEQVGCAYIGKCSAISWEMHEQDAYDPHCGLFREKRERR
jgi:hypothetical protein